MDDRTQTSQSDPRGSVGAHNALANPADNLTTADLARAPAHPAGADPVAGSKPAFAGNGGGAHDSNLPLLPAELAGGMRSAWDGIQASFVDEPRKAVADADRLVADAIRRIAESFSTERARLEHQWDRGEDVSTEDLRLALQRYRSFFQRLLSV